MQVTDHPALLASGSVGRPINAARAGYLPVPLAHVPAAAFEGVEVYLRADADAVPADAEGVFTRFADATKPFTRDQRRLLLGNGVQLVYIRMADQVRFREQIESSIVEIAEDPRMAISAKATVLYETGVELINELLADPDLVRMSRRLEHLSRAVATVVLNDPSAFSHLFTAAHHDFYTATHLVNVATYMVPLAHALGHRDADELSLISQAGLLHDIGKLYVPEPVLNKPGKLDDDDWWFLRTHPERGCEHLRKYAGIDPLIITVAGQHHERLDGSGYPAGLKSDEIHPIARICAVVDAFDAMTAFRPFKRRTFSVPEALRIIEEETPQRYDPEVVKAWVKLARANLPALAPKAPEPTMGLPVGKEDQRGHQRYHYNCPARLHVVEAVDGGEHEHRALQVVAHSISRSGLGVLSQVPLPPGTRLHVYLLARTWADEFLEAVTVRCSSFQDGWYEIGMYFSGRGAVGQEYDTHR